MASRWTFGRFSDRPRSIRCSAMKDRFCARRIDRDRDSRRFAKAKVRLAMPLVPDAANQQGAIEMDGTVREDRRIVEIARLDRVNGERLDVPGLAMELEPLESCSIGSGRKPQRSCRKERRRLLERFERRPGGPVLCNV